MRDKTEIYTVGGTVQAGKGIYIPRRADDELFDFCLNGDFVYILAPRQMGKSSLMVNTVGKLEEEGIFTTIIDLTKIGVKLEADAWYLGILTIIQQKLGIRLDLRCWWEQNSHLGVNQRLFSFFQNILLKQINCKVILFFDEIDSTLSIPFADDFFATIRAVYNERGTNSELRRISFVLIGVATPGELISNPKRTPFNIGRRVDLTGFTLQEALPLAEGLRCKDKTKTMASILSWTGGQPYLTQRICHELSKLDEFVDELKVNSIVSKLYTGDEAFDDSNIDFVMRMLTMRSKNPRRTMLIYQKIRVGEKVLDDEDSAEKAYLKLSGVVGKRNGFLELSNSIYASVFNPNWISNNIPGSPATRWIVTTAIIAVLATAWITLQYIKARNTEISIQAQTYLDGYKNSSSPDVKLTNLANLMKLGGDYTKQGLELYLNDTEQEQLRLFDLSVPNNVGDEVIFVVQQTYQYSSNDEKGNSRLTAMAVPLSQITSPGASDLLKEIETWIQARNDVSEGNFQAALLLYSNVINRSKDRRSINFQALIERAKVQTILKAYPEALRDYDTALARNYSLSNEIRKDIENNNQLLDYYSQNVGQYKNLTNLIVVPSESPTIAVSAVPTQTIAPPEISSGVLAETAFKRLGKGSVTTFAYSPRARIIAAGTTTGIYIFSGDNYSEIAKIATPYPLRSIAISPDGSLVAGVFCYKGEIYIWDTRTGNLKNKLPHHGIDMMSIAFSPDGKRLATGDLGWWTWIWDVRTGSLIKSFVNSGVVTSLRWSPDGQILASGVGNYTEGNAKVTLWNMRSFMRIYSLGKYDGFIWDVSFSKDGKFVSGGLENGKIVIWDVTSGKEVTSINSGDSQIEVLSFSSTGNQLASGSVSGLIKIWDPVSGDVEQTISIGDGSVEGLSWISDTNILAVSPVGNMYLIDIQNGEIIASEPRFSHEVNDVDVGDTTDKIVSGHHSDGWSSNRMIVNHGEVIIWSSNGEILRKFEFPDAGVNTVSWSPDLTKIAVSFEAPVTAVEYSGPGYWAEYGETRSVILDSNTGSILANYEAANAIEWVPNSSKIVIVYDDSVKILDYPSGDIEQEYQIKDLSAPSSNHGSRIYMSHDGSMIAFISEKKLSIYELLTGKEIEIIQLSDGITSVAWEPDEQRIAIGMNSEDVLIWDLQKQEQVSTLHDHINQNYNFDGPWVMAFSPDGKYLAIGMGAMDLRVNAGQVAIYDMEKLKYIGLFSGHNSWVSGLDWFPQGHQLISSSEDGSLLIWDIP